jgi:hypothetical protein
MFLADGTINKAALNTSWVRCMHPSEKCSDFECTVCGLTFKHFYDTPGLTDIYEAMRVAGVPATCEEKVEESQRTATDTEEAAAAN